VIAGGESGEHHGCGGHQDHEQQRRSRPPQDEGGEMRRHGCCFGGSEGSRYWGARGPETASVSALHISWGICGTGVAFRTRGFRAMVTLGATK
jgi:hypothetical protein